MKKMTKKQKRLYAGAGILVALVVGFYVYGNIKPSVPSGPPSMAIEGIIVCLPHKEPGPHTKECAMGLMTGNRMHYQLDTSLVSSTTKPLQVSDRIRANGRLVPVSPLVPYDVSGSFTITDSLVVE